MESIRAQFILTGPNGMSRRDLFGFTDALPLDMQFVSDRIPSQYIPDSVDVTPARARLSVIEPYPAAVTLERAVENGLGKSHKSDGQGALVLLDNEAHGNVGREGGVTDVNGHVISVRAPERRLDGSTIVHEGDLMEVDRLTNPESRYDKKATVGIEIEMLQLDQTGRLEGDRDEIDSKHPELVVGCREEATEASSSLLVVGAWYLGKLRYLRDQAAEKGRLSYPGSNVADRPLTPDDLYTGNHYIGKIIDYLGGPEEMKQINIVSEQSHIDDMGSLEAAAWSFNVEEYTAALGIPLTAASPFSAGELYPLFGKREGYPDPNFNLEYWSSRTVTRLMFPEGGVILQPVPEDRVALRALIDARMRSGIHNPSRVVGAHANRLRVDYGGRENCTNDTNGAHVESSMSLIALDRAFRFALQHAYDNGKQELLMDLFPRIIPRDFGEQTMQRMRTNMITLSKRKGLQGTAFAADGTVCTGVDMLEDKIAMVRRFVGPDSPYYVNDEMLQWVRLRAGKPSSPYDYLVDPGGVVSAESFYRGNPGPLAAYQRIRALQLVQRGMNAADALADMQRDVAEASSRYIDRMDAERDLGFLALAV